MAISFKGGVNINIRRDKTRACESKPMISCPKHVYPLVGDNGVSYVPTVQAGDKVKLGQRIAYSADSWELPMHSSVSGRVDAVRECETAYGTVNAVVVINDELYEPAEAAAAINYEEADEKELILALQNAGIADMEGGEFICGETLLGAPPKYLIVDAMQCEPYTSALCRRAAENPGDVIEGLRIVQHALRAGNIYICVDSKSREAYNAIKGEIRYDEGVTLLALKPKYPQSDKRVLVKTVTGKNDMSSCVVTNSEVMHQVCRVIKTGMPVTERIVTIGGDGILEPDNFRVPFGVPISFIAAQAKGLIDTPDRIITNGIMSGREQSGMEAVTTKNIVSIQIMLSRKKDRKTGSCIHCGRCARHCPMGLRPSALNSASLNFKPNKAVKGRIFDCIGCGACTYVCPVNIPLEKNIADMADFVSRIKGKE